MIMDTRVWKLSPHLLPISVIHRRLKMERLLVGGTTIARQSSLIGHFNTKDGEYAHGDHPRENIPSLLLWRPRRLPTHNAPLHLGSCMQAFTRITTVSNQTSFVANWNPDRSLSQVSRRPSSPRWKLSGSSSEAERANSVSGKDTLSTGTSRLFCSARSSHGLRRNCAATTFAAWSCRLDWFAASLQRVTDWSAAIIASPSCIE